MTDRPKVRELLLADVFRLTGRRSWFDVVKLTMIGEVYRVNVAFRFASVYRTRRAPHAKVIAVLSRLWLRRLRRRLGINLACTARVGAGLHIGHAGTMYISPGAIIGRDCNIAQNVTIAPGKGEHNGGQPTLGDRVYVGPGAVIFGAVTIGDDVAIGANSVVTRDIPAGCTAVGAPARVLPGRGSGDYVNRVSTPRIARQAGVADRV
ncbi:MAG TPA: serine acetyltransferase [Sporichthyaceae bacterium]|jgi:serine O-acetyltransferase